jgi:HEAT repeat protein
LSDPNPTVAWSAAVALTKIDDVEAKKAIPALLKLSDYPELRRETLEALVRIGPGAIPELNVASEDSDETRSKMAKEALRLIDRRSKNQPNP